MVAKKITTKTIKRSEYRTYLKKASEFHDIMLEAKKREKWNAVGLNLEILKLTDRFYNWVVSNIR